VTPKQRQSFAGWDTGAESRKLL